MKPVNKYFLVILLSLIYLQANTQDKMVLINQDTIDIKLRKNTSERLTFSYWGEDLENEISTLLVNAVVMGSGRVITYKTTPIKPYTDKVGSGNMTNRIFTDTLYREAKLFFNNHHIFSYQLEIPSEYANTLLGEYVRVIDNPFKKLDNDIEVRGYAFGAYLTLLKRSGDYLNCFAFYNAYSKDRINALIKGKEFNLEESILVYTGFTKKDEKLKYTIRFNEDGTCLYREGEKTIEGLRWSLLDNNVLKFYSDIKGSKPDLWTIVYLWDDSLRMTSLKGAQGSNFVSRLLKRIN